MVIKVIENYILGDIKYDGNKKIKESNISITVYSDKNINLSSANDIFSIGVDSIFVDNPLDLLGKF